MDFNREIVVLKGLSFCILAALFNIDLLRLILKIQIQEKKTYLEIVWNMHQCCPNDWTLK